MTLQDLLAFRDPDALDTLFRSASTRVPHLSRRPRAVAGLDDPTDPSAPVGEEASVFSRLAAIREPSETATIAACKPGKADRRTVAPPPSAIVLQARQVLDLLGIRSAVIIGGQREREALRSLIADLQIAIEWPTTVTSSTPRCFGAAARKAGLIIAAVRWSRHTHGDFVNRLHRTDGIPLVRLTGGYNSNAVAYAVVTQLGRNAKPT